MAFSGLLMLIDDVAAIADDVGTLTAAATKQSAGLVTDDMAVTAEQALGFAREREIPVVLQVAKGSMFNKTVILAPAALVLNIIAPWAIHPILMCGGLYLAYEGVEKVVHTVAHRNDSNDISSQGQISAGTEDLLEFEQERVRGAIRTDLILSAEIVAMTLGMVSSERFVVQALVLYAVAIIVTVGVFTIVGGLVKIDDFGVWLAEKGGSTEKLGLAIVRAAPVLLKIIAWVGTVAMLMVGGHILMTGIPPWYEWVHHTVEHVHNPTAAYFAGAGFDIATGVAAGVLLVGIAATQIPAKLWAMRPWAPAE